MRKTTYSPPVTRALKEAQMATEALSRLVDEKVDEQVRAQSREEQGTEIGSDPQAPLGPVASPSIPASHTNPKSGLERQSTSLMCPPSHATVFAPRARPPSPPTGSELM